MNWHTCPHCKKDKYCSDDKMRDHIEDCPQRPSQQKNKPCPKCKGVLERISASAWICTNATCDYTLGMLPGGKV